MRTYFLITGAWLAAAALTAYVYARLAGFAAGSDAHLREPRPGRRQRTPFAVPGWILAPLAMGCIASVLMADFALAPESTPTPIAAAPSQSVRMADPAERSEPRTEKRKPRRAARRSPQRSRPAAGAVQVAGAPATTPVAAAPRFVRTTVPARPAPPARTRRPRRRDTAPAAPKPSRPKPVAPAAPTAVAAAVPTPSPSPVPEPPAPSPAPAPAQPAAKPEGRSGPPPHAQANGHDEEKWTVHPPSKQVPGRVHRSKAPAGRPRCACR